MQDVAGQLEYVTSKCQTVESLFGSELMSRRQKMKDLCQKLMFHSPKANGAIARDKVWRYVFYDVVNKAKRLRQVSDWQGEFGACTFLIFAKIAAALPTRLLSHPLVAFHALLTIPFFMEFFIFWKKKFRLWEITCKNGNYEFQFSDAHHLALRKRWRNS